jgi:hypothetical protein
VHRSTAIVISAGSLLWAVGCSSGAPLAEGVSLTIDGKKQALRGAVSCSSHSAGDAVKVGNMPDGIYVHISPQIGGVVTTEELDLGNSTGESLVGANTTVTRLHDGAYHITGTAVRQDATAPKFFELIVKCP